jgi:type VI secretion system protein ImpF
MAELAQRERLQPALLDRLTDDTPDDRQPEPRELRVINKTRFRQGVLRDMAWLLNATRTLGPDELAGLDYVESSVVDFGLPALSGETASTVDVLDLEDRVRQALLFYEPRILANTLEVHALFSESDMHQHNVVSIEIRGSLWAHPIPIEMLLRTDLDLETGEVRIHELDGPGTR